MANQAQKSAPFIVCAAIKTPHGAIICGPRHFDNTMRQQISNNKVRFTQTEQGFVDQFGVFYNRRDAMEIAVIQGQIRRDFPVKDGKLYSEHLY